MGLWQSEPAATRHTNTLPNRKSTATKYTILLIRMTTQQRRSVAQNETLEDFQTEEPEVPKSNDQETVSFAYELPEMFGAQDIHNSRVT